jgi:hypothetical protein
MLNFSTIKDPQVKFFVDLQHKLANKDLKATEKRIQFQDHAFKCDLAAKGFMLLGFTAVIFQKTSAPAFVASFICGGLSTYFHYYAPKQIVSQGPINKDEIVNGWITPGNPQCLLSYWKEMRGIILSSFQTCGSELTRLDLSAFKFGVSTKQLCLGAVSKIDNDSLKAIYEKVLALFAAKLNPESLCTFEQAEHFGEEIQRLCGFVAGDDVTPRHDDSKQNSLDAALEVDESVTSENVVTQRVFAVLSALIDNSDKDYIITKKEVETLLAATPNLKTLNLGSLYSSSIFKSIQHMQLSTLYIKPTKDFDESDFTVVKVHHLPSSVKAKVVHIDFERIIEKRDKEQFLHSTIQNGCLAENFVVNDPKLQNFQPLHDKQTNLQSQADNGFEQLCALAKAEPTAQLYLEVSKEIVDLQRCIPGTPKGPERDKLERRLATKHDNLRRLVSQNDGARRYQELEKKVNGLEEPRLNAKKLRKVAVTHDGSILTIIRVHADGRITPVQTPTHTPIGTPTSSPRRTPNQTPGQKGTSAFRYTPKAGDNIPPLNPVRRDSREMKVPTSPVVT